MSQLVKEQIQKLSKDELESWFEERLTQVVTYAEESAKSEQVRLERKITKLETKLSDRYPATDKWIKDGFYFYRPSRLNGNIYGLAKAWKLNVTHYDVNGVVYPLPDNLKVRGFKCYIVFYFNDSDELCHMGLLGSRFNNIRTFHTHQTHMCLGQYPFHELQKTLKPKDTAGMMKAASEIMDVLTIVNLASPLCDKEDSGFVSSLVPVWDYVKQKRRELIPEDECRHCDEPVSNCQCPYCDVCSQHEDDCYCTYCEDCDRRYNSDVEDCDCHFCSSCGDRYSSCWTDECECDRCYHCNLSEDDCGCERFETEDAYDERMEQEREQQQHRDGRYEVEE